MLQINGLTQLHALIIMGMAEIFTAQQRYATVQDIQALAAQGGVTDPAQVGQAVQFLVDNQVMVQPDPNKPTEFALYQPALDQAQAWKQQMAQAQAAPAPQAAPTPQAAPAPPAPAQGGGKGKGKGGGKGGGTTPQTQTTQAAQNGGELAPGISAKAPKIVEYKRADTLSIPELIERIKIGEAGAVANRDAGQAIVAEHLTRSAARMRRTLAKKLKEAQATQQAAPAQVQAAPVVPFTFPQ